LQIIEKTTLYSDFKNPYKNIYKPRKLEFIHEWHFEEQKNKRRKQDKSLSLRSLEFMFGNFDYK
jgi:hypothetical protein